MDILVVAHFTGELDGNDNSRFLDLCEMLHKNPENKVELVTSDFSHVRKTKKRANLSLFPYKITFITAPRYPTNVCVQRLVSHHEFGNNLKKYLDGRKSPDVIYCSVPSISCAYETAKYAKKRHIRFIIDVQDIWPEAFRLKFNYPVVSDLVFAPFTARVNYAYAQADEIVAVSETYARRALKVNKKCTAYHSVFLGTDFSKFDTFKEEYRVEKQADELWIGYVGTLGASYDITCVSHAVRKINADSEAKKLLEEAGYSKIVFQVMGDGPQKAEFMQDARECGIESNFTGQLPYSEMVGRLCMCDLAVNPINHGAAQSIINKVGDYAAAGLAVINTLENKEYRKLVHDYRCGFNCKANDPDSVAAALKKWLGLTEEQRNKMGQNSRRLGEERFDRSKTYQELVNLIEKR